MSIKITQAAIEAAARALRDHYQWTWMNLNCIEVSAKALEAAEAAKGGREG